MATGQSILDRMELLNAELQLQPGEADVSRGLLALNVAQDYFESLAAVRLEIFGSSEGSLAVVGGSEKTAFPTGVLRIDKLQYIDPTSSLPAYDLRNIKEVGGHAVSGYYPWYLISSVNNPGQVAGYWTNGTNIYWAPRPSSNATIRWYGFQSAADVTASGTFAYPDNVMLPLASFACRIIKSGLDDSASDLGALAQSTFTSTLDQLQNFNRDGAEGFHYSERHDT